MRGFLIIVIIALAIIAMIYTGQFSKKKEPVHETAIKSINKTKVSFSETNVRNISHAVDSYHADNGHYPDTLQQLVPRYLSESDLSDGWSNTFRLETNENNDLFLVSPGRDTILGNTDDIRRRL